MLGGTVDAIISKSELFVRGVGLLLAEFEGEVKVFSAREENMTKTIEKLGDEIGNDWDSILLTYPIFYFPSKLEFAKYLIEDRLYWRKYRGKKTKKEKWQVLRDYSEYVHNAGLFNPMDRILRILADKTGRKTPIVFANYRELHKGAAAICFKGKINSIFHDIFPARGNSFEETIDVIKNAGYYIIERISTVKAGLGIGKVNGMKVVEYFKKKTVSEDIKRKEFLNKAEDGSIRLTTPYGISFISKRMYGSINLGVMSYPVEIWPSLFELDYFYDRAAFSGEYGTTIHSFAKIADRKKFIDSFDFYIMDNQSISMCPYDLHKLPEILDRKSRDWFGVFSTTPSAYLPSPDRRYLTEIDNNICIGCSGTSVMLEFMK